jgi:hypothetical protein
MDLADRSRMMGMTSSVTATMRSPKVVLMIFRWRMVFSLCRRIRPSAYQCIPFFSISGPAQKTCQNSARCEIVQVIEYRKI